MRWSIAPTDEFMGVWIPDEFMGVWIPQAPTAVATAAGPGALCVPRSNILLNSG